VDIAELEQLFIEGDARFGQGAPVAYGAVLTSARERIAPKVRDSVASLLDEVSRCKIAAQLVVTADRWIVPGAAVEQHERNTESLDLGEHWVFQRRGRQDQSVRPSVDEALDRCVVGPIALRAR